MWYTIATAVVSTLAKTAFNLLEHWGMKEIDKHYNESADKERNGGGDKGPGNSVQESPATSPIAGPSHSTTELFCRSRPDNTGWIVSRYMKEGLINLLGAAAGVGKSNLLVQIARAVGLGIPPEFLPSDSENSVKRPVLFYRLEDYPGENEGKYGDGKALDSAGIKWYLPKDLPGLCLEGFLSHLKDLASKMKVDTVVFVDPATKLSSYSHQAFIKGVEEAMAIAKGHDVTLTIVASIHIDETKDWKVVGSDDIKGGDKALQQAGSVTIFIKERTGKDYRYLKCMKAPKGNPEPFDGDVLVCKAVETDEENRKFLHYKYVEVKSEELAIPTKLKAIHTTEDSSHSPEGYHKPAPNQKITQEKFEQMKVMLAKGIPDKDIAKELGVTDRTIRTYKKAIKEEAA